MSYSWTPPAEDRDDAPSLRRYIDTVRQRWWLIAVATIVCVGVAVAYVTTAPKVYETHADMLITPVPDDSSTPLGLGLIRRASDPTRDVTTASRLIDNEAIAARVARMLKSNRSPESLLSNISVDPVAQSSIVSITASDNSPRGAQALANAFGRAAVEQRTEMLHSQVEPAIARLKRQIAQLPTTPNGTVDPAAQSLYDQLSSLEQLSEGSDPTLRLETPAALPGGPSSPRAKLSIVAGIIAGLLLGTAGAFAADVLDPRRTREDRLAKLGIPVLTRVPRVSRSRPARHAFDEAFRFLRTALRLFGEDSLHTIAVTSASDSEGKTTSAFQFARAALEAGQSVLLVEADVYRPGLRRLVESSGDWNLDSPGLLDYLAGAATLEEVVQTTSVPGLQLLASGSPSAESITGLLETERGRSLVPELASYADVVVLDCPPVGPRADALILASRADGVLFVVDIKRSTEDAMTSAVSRLEAAGANLLGAVVNRDEATEVPYEYVRVTGSRARQWPRPRVARR